MKKPVYIETQMTRLGHIKIADEDTFIPHWKEDVKTADKYTQYRRKVIEVLEKFRTMWNTHLG